MAYKLAVIGVGDVRKQDKGLAIYLLDKLEEIFSQFNISFIYAGVDGEDLCRTLEEVKAERVIILDTMREIIDPGEIDYLTIKPTNPKKLKELLLVTIGIFSDEWGKKLSNLIAQKFYEILNKISNLVTDLLD